MVYLKYLSDLGWGLVCSVRRSLKVTTMDSTVSFSKGKNLALGLNDSTYSIRTFDLRQNPFISSISTIASVWRILPVSDSDGLPDCSDA